MKIVLVTLFFPPTNSIASLRLYSFAKQWEKEGHEITIITFPKNDKDNYDLNLDIKNFKIIEMYSIFNSIQNFYRKKIKKNFTSNVTSASTNKNNYISTLKNRFLNFIKNKFIQISHKKGILGIYRMPDPKDFWIRKASKFITNEIKPDLIVSSCGPYSTHLVAYFAKRKNKNIKWIADYRDLWTSNPFYSGIFPFNRVEKIIEKYILKKANLITTVSHGLKNELEIMLDQNVYVVENGFDEDDSKNISNTPFYPNDDIIRLIYTGTIYEKYYQSIELLFNLIAESVKIKPLLKINLIFYSKYSPTLESLIKKHNLSNYVFQSGYLSREECLMAQRDSTINILLGLNDYKFNGVLSGKIFEYIYSKTPILCINYNTNSEIFKIFKDTNAIYTNINSINEFSLFNKKLLEYKSINKKEFSENEFPYSRATLASNLLKKALTT
ncbi:glycosyltransferase [Silvanigrella paludirubra]|uniref:Glycosyltransferase n=1 Tax=Silvanigrella paludirubra TaxID=2499159 RepID=A0A6N6VUR0_9BACT|nr:glycosyltransferase [Silvanigrella paludirubra]KAB8036831.1 glycosyltransferase [Silvanigrella paludirubra]